MAWPVVFTARLPAWVKDDDDEGANEGLDADLMPEARLDVFRCWLVFTALAGDKLGCGCCCCCCCTNEVLIPLCGCCWFDNGANCELSMLTPLTPDCSLDVLCGRLDDFVPDAGPDGLTGPDDELTRWPLLAPTWRGPDKVRSD